MNSANHSAELNCMLATLQRSLPMYLVDAAPWTHPGDEKAMHLLHHIVTDYRHYSGRIVDLLLHRRQRLSFGEYPMAYTDTHDLALDYLIKELIYYQKQDLGTIEKCVAELKTDSAAKTLAEEVVGNCRGHLESLLELSKQPA